MHVPHANLTPLYIIVVIVVVVVVAVVVGAVLNSIVKIDRVCI
jgi:hypothetical protein